MNGQFSHRALNLLQTLARPKGVGVLAVGALSVMAVYNAAFGQTGSHPATIIAMRDAGQNTNKLTGDEMALPAGQAPGKGVTRIVFANPQTATEQSSSKPKKTLAQPTIATRPTPSTLPNDQQQIDPLFELQGLLAQLGFYDDDIDGKAGPKTRTAIENYKTSAGLQGIELSTEQLVTSARNNLMVTAAIPVARPDRQTIKPQKVETVVFRAPGSEENGNSAAVPVKTDTPVEPTNLDEIKRVQAGLRKFAGDHIVVDGIFGGQTRDAISEFQSVFRLDITGQIDAKLIDMMQQVGLFDS